MAPGAEAHAGEAAAGAEAWRRELAGAVRSEGDLAGILGRPVPETGYPLLVPRRLAERIRAAGEGSPLWRQFVPDRGERSDWGLADPIGDHARSPVPRLVHRYRDRALLMPTHACPVACRHCFRKNELSLDDALFRPGLDDAFAYLRAHPEVREVILSGGDPLVLADGALDALLARIRALPSVRDARIHTRVPVVLPSRATPALASLLGRHARSFRFLHVVVHANHASEIDADGARALGSLAASGAGVLAQSVLLKGVNDSPDALLSLFGRLLDLGVRPYYLHHPDRVRGGERFHLGFAEGLRIWRAVRGRLPGWAAPRYVADSPEGTGKEDVASLAAASAKEATAAASAKEATAAASAKEATRAAARPRR